MFKFDFSNALWVSKPFIVKNLNRSVYLLNIFYGITRLLDTWWHYLRVILYIIQKPIKLELRLYKLLENGSQKTTSVKLTRKLFNTIGCLISTRIIDISPVTVSAESTHEKWAVSYFILVPCRKLLIHFRAAETRVSEAGISGAICTTFHR